MVSQLLYPNGTAAAPATGFPCKVYRGWPVPASLDQDIRAGVANISVCPMEGEQNVTRYSREWLELPSPKLTLTLTVAGETVIVGGKVCCPTNAAVVVNGTPYVYPVQATDTLASVATALASLVAADRPASSSGAVLTVPGARTLEGRVGAVGSVVQEVKRQKKPFRISAWCGTPQARDAIAAVLDAALADATFISLTDGTAGRIRYERTHVIDAAQKAWLYRRDFHYSVEYATTNVRFAAEVVGDIIHAAGSPAAVTTNP
ncbi:hypothetical protein R5W24_000484 [Gemmata sp. JC717]|uniref:hypothetical protein n=1 Tax=Gemmata algarum TaxID=2975278 RepID=UPI0021BAC128|nr:hypothetical protein [Gemmata algarum]MDY3551408.1 hypothetical protein [Gemmata algarum]